MIAMQRVQPEIKKLQAKYKNDRQKLNEEMMKFYKENQINPLGGCLPLLLQMPIFIALFQTLRDIQKFIPHRARQMYDDICGATRPSKCKPNMHFSGMNLTTSASKAASSGFCGRVALPRPRRPSSWSPAFIQQRQTMRNQTQANPQMAIISKVFPVVFALHLAGACPRVSASTSHLEPLADRPAGGRVPDHRRARIERALERAESVCMQQAPR